MLLQYTDIKHNILFGENCIIWCNTKICLIKCLQCMCRDLLIILLRLHTHCRYINMGGCNGLKTLFDWVTIMAFKHMIYWHFEATCTFCGTINIRRVKSLSLRWQIGGACRHGANQNDVTFWYGITHTHSHCIMLMVGWGFVASKMILLTIIVSHKGPGRWGLCDSVGNIQFWWEDGTLCVGWTHHSLDILWQDFDSFWWYRTSDIFPVHHWSSWMTMHLYIIPGLYSGPLRTPQFNVWSGHQILQIWTP